MKNQINLDEIKDETGKRAFLLSISALQEVLPSGSYVSGCVHNFSGMTWVHLLVHVDGEPHEINWSGKQLVQFAHFIEGNLVPILHTWGRSLSEFFQNLSMQGYASGAVCQAKECALRKGIVSPVGEANIAIGESN